MWLDVDRMLSEMDMFRRRMDDLYDLFQDTQGEFLSPLAETRSGMLEAMVYDLGDSFVIEADMPGVDPAAVTLEATQRGVTISGQRGLDLPDNARIHLQERAAWRFSRAFHMPVAIDSDKAKAEFRNGVLRVTLPKSAEAHPRRITVNA